MWRLPVVSFCWSCCTWGNNKNIFQLGRVLSNLRRFYPFLRLLAVILHFQGTDSDCADRETAGRTYILELVYNPGTFSTLVLCLCSVVVRKYIPRRGFSVAVLVYPRTTKEPPTHGTRSIHPLSGQVEKSKLYC